MFICCLATWLHGCLAAWLLATGLLGCMVALLYWLLGCLIGLVWGVCCFAGGGGGNDDDHDDCDGGESDGDGDGDVDGGRAACQKQRKTMFPGKLHRISGFQPEFGRAACQKTAAPGLF